MARVVGHQMFTPEGAREHVQQALTIVDELDIPEDLRVAAFAGALNLVSLKTPTVENDRVLETIPEHLLRGG